MSKTNIFLAIFNIIILAPLVYIFVWLGIFVNLVEEPLPESEERIPDMGVVDDNN